MGRWALIWMAAALLATAALGTVGAFAGHWPEGVHLAGHVILCGGLAAMAAASARGSDGARAAWGLAAAMVLGLGIEAIQLRHGPPAGEVLFDLAVDTLGAVAGVVVWSLLGEPRRETVGHVISAVLHPLFVAPLGCAVVLFAATRDLGLSLVWTGYAALCMLPCIGLWVVGTRSGWWSDADVSRRTDRPALFAMGIACLMLLLAISLTGPDAAERLASTALLGATLGTAVTLARLKVSGHVAIPAALAALAWPGSTRAAALLLGVAVLVSWARYAAQRHQPSEVAAGWGLALSVSWLVGTF